MRPENEWFKPEQLTRYYYAVEALALAVVAAAVGVLAVTGVLFAVNDWVVLVGGGAVAAAFAFLTWWTRAFYRTADYRLGDEELEYRRGVFFRQRTAVPYNRITNVDAAQGPLQRLVGAGTVGVHTAGFGGQTGAELSVTGVRDYEEIKDQILGKVRRRRPESTEGDDAVETGRAGGEVGSESQELLVELRRIRELLEGGRTA